MWKDLYALIRYLHARIMMIVGRRAQIYILVAKEPVKPILDSADATGIAGNLQPPCRSSGQRCRTWTDRPWCHHQPPHFKLAFNQLWTNNVLFNYNPHVAAKQHEFYFIIS
ncbi:hypothetical protein Dimus_025419 [Dionaea muscipula]